MDVKKLAVIVDAILLGSFNKAAEKYAYTPSALSHIADAVEDELGVQIIKRNYHGVTLTKAGEELFPHLQKLISQAENVRKIAKSLYEQEQTLTIGCYASISKTLLPEIIRSFQQAYPNVRVHVAVDGDVSEMKRKNADVFFVEEHESEGMKFLPVYRDDYVAVVLEGQFPNRKVLRIEDFQDKPFILQDDSNVVNAVEGKLNNVMQVLSDDNATAISMVTKGFGSAILPALSVKNLTKGLKLIQLQPTITRTLGIAYDDEAKNPAMKPFFHFISHSLSHAKTVDIPPRKLVK